MVKFNYIITIHNKEALVEEVMKRVLMCCRDNSHIYPVLDGCTDRTEEFIDNIIDTFANVPITKVHTPDVHELLSINAGLRAANQQGDGYNIVLQDDVLLADFMLERKVVALYEWAGPKLGYLSFRLGTNFINDAVASETAVPYTDYVENAYGHGLPQAQVLLPGEFTYRTVPIKSPVCFPFELIRNVGMLNEHLAPYGHDDMDYSIRCIKAGYRNAVFAIRFYSEPKWGGTRAPQHPQLNQTIRRNMKRIRNWYGADIEEIIRTIETADIIEVPNMTNKAEKKKALTEYNKAKMEQKGDSVRLPFPMKQAQTGQLVFEETKDDRQTEMVPCRGDISISENEKEIHFTLFAMPKAFTDVFAPIQRNAIGSWMQLRSRPEIIFLGDDDGVADFARRCDFKHIPNVERNEFGTPLLNDVFLKAQAAASNEICVYVNADIILMDSFAEALESVARRFNEFLMVGRRWDIDISQEIDFGAEGWQQRLTERLRTEGFHHAPTGIDYFAFKKGLWPEIPPMALGRDAWDNWLVREPLLMGKPIIDASGKVTIIHQNHDFSHIPGGKESASFRIEQRRNMELGGNDGSLAYTSHASWELTPAGITLRPISEFLKEDNLSAALKCIESAYQQAPGVIEEQCEAIRPRIDAGFRIKLLSAARRELVLGSAKNAARLLLDSLEAEGRPAAEESFKKGFQCLNDGDASRAVKHLEQAAANCTTLPNVYYAMATAYAQLGDIFSAKRACQIELSLQPANRGAAELLERIDKAANEYRQSLIG